MEQIKELEFVTTDQVEAFIGDDRKSTTSSSWLRAQLAKNEVAVHEFITLAINNGFKTIGHLFAQRKESSVFLAKFAAEGKIEISEDYVVQSLLGDLTRKLEYALMFRNSVLSKIDTKAPEQEVASLKMKKQWQNIIDTPIEQLRPGNGWTEYMRRV